ncbi:heme A synthase [Variibacter gotjawalensis]|uniref:Heme A synthase n=1 Tax=Variibacter gotjawalensis TaxID=1333996 RepID=A0A0S3PX49_9BRAD|nr:cytochrome c oxidase assembly protein subunit 15 [Variibacter gotjawalensis]RZS48264.1 cytochrome c oxidase assembly protein subunit 15 [Variibacter gotjawalensis]BAT60524.1 heme A synthase [Variibacter gotjawalensis]
MRVWLIVVAALIGAIVLVGGATRLTESGLSIVEWKPITGALPPLSEAAWQAEFEKYKTIPQYEAINKGMALQDFKTIYLWEWGHRLLGRVIGAAFLLPFLWFLWRGAIRGGLRWRLWGIFALGGIQGAVGWWMVASGLTQRISVSPYRLAFHLTLACLIFAAIVWTLQRLSGAVPLDANTRIRRTAVALLALVILQIYIGGLVAGLDAGMNYNTWPLIDGAIMPSCERLLFLSPLWKNFFENDLTVQFVHRCTAYAIWLLAVFHAVDATRARRGAVSTAHALAAMVTLQAAIGIATLLAGTPIGLALFHQGGAVVTLGIATWHAARLTQRVPAEHLSAIPAST